MDHQNSVVRPDCQVQRSKSSALLKGIDHCAYINHMNINGSVHEQTSSNSGPVSENPLFTT